MDVDRHHGKFSSACASAEFVDIDFNSPYAANVFDYEALNDPVIQKQRKAPIEEADTFFNDDFPPSSPSWRRAARPRSEAHPDKKTAGICRLLSWVQAQARFSSSQAPWLCISNSWA
ncbi:hypothetical protein [Aeromonas bivalvium]|uniref:hypothetical protein n=1 Tax=Aeromonas bivalvium TaxID=440079 RepID=UPI001FD54368|nr:hypothetical protein [Aeromonas bivalvium]